MTQKHQEESDILARHVVRCMGAELFDCNIIPTDDREALGMSSSDFTADMEIRHVIKFGTFMLSKQEMQG